MSVSVSYVSHDENGTLQFSDYPFEKFIHRLAGELQADEDELLLLAVMVPSSTRARIQQCPHLFKKLANIDKRTLDQLKNSMAESTFEIEGDTILCQPSVRMEVVSIKRKRTPA